MVEHIISYFIVRRVIFLLHLLTMKRLGAVLVTLGTVALVIAAVFFVVGYFRPAEAGLQIKTTPEASVFIDGVEVGKTPYQAKRKPGEVVVRLVPTPGDKPLAPYETRVTLVSKIETAINREFGESEEKSAGETISFEKTGGKEAALSIVSIPDSAQISIDGTQRAFAPYKTSLFAPGKHEIGIVAPNYLERSFEVRTLAGYKLTVVVKLAPTGETNQEVPKEEIKVTMVEVLTTPTGFLRVRATPSAGGEVLAELKPGEKYRYLETDSATGWFKIEYLPAQAGEKGKEGWVSNQYSKITEEATPTATPSAT